MAFAQKCPGGTELEISMLFVDVRGSTRLAERMSATDFGRLMNRFYETATHVLIDTDSVIDKLVGDEVIGFYLPIFTGPNHSRPAVIAAQRLLRAAAEVAEVADPESRFQIGIGVHTGNAYVGTVSGAEDTVTDITALGDNVNVAARLASMARPEEALISEAASVACGLDLGPLEERRLQIKGRTEPITTRVLRADSPIETVNHEAKGETVIPSRVGAGALAGLVAGLVYGIVIQRMAMPMPMGDPQPMMDMVARVARSDSLVIGWTLVLVTGVIGGAVFGAALGERAARVGAGLAWGALYGVFLWVAGGLVLMPIVLGMSAFAPLTMAPMRSTSLANLAVYILSGLILGGVFAGLAGRESAK